MIPQAVEYSLRAMVLLAQGANEPLTVQAIAKKGHIPAAYLAKLLQGLTRVGLVASKRGPGGGFVLARLPAEIRLADIVNVVEPIQRITACPLGIEGHLTLCSLHHWLDQLLAHTEAAFVNTTLADICGTNQCSGGSIPLCSSPSLLANNLHD